MARVVQVCFNDSLELPKMRHRGTELIRDIQRKLLKRAKDSGKFTAVLWLALSIFGSINGRGWEFLF